MTTVRTPNGSVIEVGSNDQQLLTYYRREPGYEILPDAPTEVVEDDSGTVSMPTKSASKADWYEFAKSVDEDVASYDDITHAQLVDKYGGE